jgi:uncharacterized protein YlxW (UPF0749 family)
VPNRQLLTLSSVIAVLGFLAGTAVVTGRAERRQEAPRKAQLVGLIDDRRSLVGDLDQAVVQLRREVDQAQARASRADSRDAEAAVNAARLARQAGTVALQGRGMVVTLAPSDRQPPSAEEAGAYQIHDSDLQLVVNSLWASGAEAVAINDSRLVATTPIRSAGATIVVNFRPLSPPFTVTAIGASRTTFESSEIAKRFRRWTDLFGLGFSVRDAKQVKVPAYTGRVSIASASPGNGGTP